MFRKLLRLKNKLIICLFLSIFVLINYEKKKRTYTTISLYEICKLPELNYSLPLEEFKPIPKCLDKNWGSVDTLKHKWTLSQDIITELKEIKCSYRKVERINDFRVNLGGVLELRNGQIIQDDVVDIECTGQNKTNNSTAKFNYLNVQIVDSEPKKRYDIQKDKNGCFPYNVMLLSYDSVSRVSFVRRLKKTYDLIRTTDNFYVLKGYNIVGDGTPQALIPIFTGFTEEELPSALKNDPNGKYVDEVYPFIWKELHQKNYTSIYLDDWPHVGAFTYRMRGFKNHTTKHYPKHYQIHMQRKHRSLKKKNDFCNGGTKRHKVMMNLLTNFKSIYEKRQSNLAIMHYVENSHDSNNHLHWVDDDIFEFLKNGFKDHLFDNTIIFLYSDHGSRFNKFRNSQRYLEERLPFVSVYLPDSFIKNNPEKVSNFRENIAKLTSPFDIHSTVRDLTCLKREKISDRQRSISLFDRISLYRSCEDIGIAEHFCTCVRSWKKENTNSTVTQNAALFAIETINSITSLKKDLCQRLKLKTIISSESVILNNNLLFRVSFVSSPNNGVYETIVYTGQKENFEFTSENFSIKSKNDLSRIDSYGEQPWCVAKFGSNPGLNLDLRKFCFCFPKLPKTQNKTTKLKLDH